MLEWLPGAQRDERGGFGWQVNCPYKGVIHTTEGPSWPNYPPRYHPNATIRPIPGVGVEIRQHAPLDHATYALVHANGTVATNGARAIQFELVGTCDPAGPKGAYYWPDADDAVLRDLYAKVIKPVSDAYGIKLLAPIFKAYPASYGANGVRLSGQAWLDWDGWLGHEHVPGGNDHGDPGAFPWDRLMRLAHTTPEDDVPLTPAEIIAIADASARAIHNQQIYRNTWTGADGKEHPLLFADALLQAARKPFPSAAQVADAVKAALAGVTPGAAANGPIALTDADVARIAKATIDELSTRTVK